MVNAPGHLKVACVHCGQHIEFPHEALGTVIDCPDCRLSTPLTIPGLDKVGAMPDGFAPRLPDFHWWPTLLGYALAIIAVLLIIYQTDPAIVWPICLFSAAVLVYFLPAIVARHKRNATAITVLNLFLGWTLIGWVVALVWACTVENEKSPRASSLCI